MTTPAIPQPVADAFARYPEAVRAQLLAIRTVIFAVADETDGVGKLTETLKWGEPAYLTKQSKSGTTIRLGVSRQAPDKAALFVNCQTSLIETFRSHFAQDFTFEGNRALIVPEAQILPREPLAMCIKAALVYHRRKT